MITTPDKLRLDAARLDAYLEAFERTYLHFLETGSDEQEQRIRGSFAFFEIRDKVEGLMSEMEELAGHMEVCNAILAVASTKEGVLCMTGTAKVEIAGKAAVVEQEGKSVRVLLHEGETLYAARDILKACGTKYPEKWCAREFRDQTRVRMLKLLYPARGKTGGMNRRTYEMYFTDEAGGLTILEMIGCDNGVRDWLKTEVFPYKLSRPGAKRTEKTHEPPICPPASDGMKDRLEYVNNQIDAMLFALLELKKYIAQPNV